MIRRRRPLMRAAMVGGTAYAVGKHAQRGQDREYDQEARIEELEAQQMQAAAPPPPASGGISDATIQQLQQLAQLKEQGILTPDEFEAQKRKLLGTT
jgi:Short C-terminal domain